MILPITKSRYKLLKLIYLTKGVKVSRMLRILGVSQKIGYEHLDELIKAGVISDDRLGSMRILKPELRSESGRLVYSLIEKERVFEFLEIYPEFSKGVKMINDNSKNMGINCLLMFGSFTSKREDDAKINILVISDNTNKEKLIEFLKQAFSDVKNAVLARIISSESFLKLKIAKQDLYEKVLREYVVIHNPEVFINLTV